MDGARIALEKAPRTEKNPRHGYHAQRPAPALRLRHEGQMSENAPANYVTQGAADRNRREKQCENPTAPLDRKQIGQNRGRRGTVSSLAHPNENPGEKQDAERGRQTRTGGRETPKNNSQTDDHPSGKPISQPAQGRSDEHIGNEKRAAQNAADCQGILVPGQETRRPDRWFHRGQDLAGDIVKNVNPERWN